MDFEVLFIPSTMAAQQAPTLKDTKNHFYWRRLAVTKGRQRYSFGCSGTASQYSFEVSFTLLACIREYPWAKKYRTVRFGLSSELKRQISVNVYYFKDHRKLSISLLTVICFPLNMMSQIRGIEKCSCLLRCHLCSDRSTSCR